ncbi:MAG: CoA ester lyase [Solirubrobacterales bacterium]|nr:CoA ester lyase [Solirubrobacterales bacterium]
MGPAVPLTRRRSVLYMPGANERALAKARDLPADALILDLEDAVAPAAKRQARERVCAAVASGAYGTREVAIRVNAIGTEWHDDDVRGAAAAGPDGILVPKVASAQDVRDTERALEHADAPERTRIWAMLETPAAVVHAAEIAAASPRLAVLVMGTNDLASELFAELTPGRAPLLGSLSTCIVAARSAGAAIIDGVYNDLRDLAGFEAECRQGRELGFDGKTLIHPVQLEPCNRVFTPSETEVAHARRVVQAFAQAARAGAGVATLDGRLIENLHVRNAERALALAGHPTTTA